MKKYSFLFLIIFLTGLFVNAQNVEFEKKNFPDRKKEFKEASKNLKSGYKIYDEAIKHCLIIDETGSNIYCKEASLLYANAYEYLKKAYVFNPKNALLNFRIGVYFLNASTIKASSLQYLENASLLDKNVDKELYYLLGRANHLNLDFDKAIEYYEKYLSQLAPADYDVSNKKVKKNILECKNGIELIKTPVRVFIDNIGSTINTPYPEYRPLISADESIMIFTARRDVTTGGDIDPNDNMYYEDIYYTYNKNNRWTTPVPFNNPINTDNHDATAGMSADGEHFFIYRGWKNGGDIFVCDKDGEEWTNPQRIKNINTDDFRESSATFSYDFKTIYFCSDKEGGFGGRDIYFCQHDKKRKWTDPTNIGAIINTEYDEDGVFMHPDGKTFYFSSKGHNSMGGYDIFKSELIDGKWSKPINLGYPINTPDDDVFISVNASGTRGYYTSIRPEGYGDKDIYVINFLGAEKPLVINTEDNLFSNIEKPTVNSLIEPVVELKRNSLTLLKGTVTDAVTKAPLAATLVLIDNEKNEEIAEFTTNSKSGKFLVSLPSGKNYGIAVKADDYLFHSENFEIPESSDYLEVEKNIEMKKVAVGSKIVLRNIFFDFDKATLRPESYAELDRLTKLLTDVPSLKIEISGHTDNKGSDEYNQKLSEMRAKSVVDYLIKEKKIASDRLEYKGYGETQPIATNDTDEGRQLNRRTEFKILSK